MDENLDLDSNVLQSFQSHSIEQMRDTNFILVDITFKWRCCTMISNSKKWIKLWTKIVLHKNHRWWCATIFESFSLEKAVALLPIEDGIEFKFLAKQQKNPDQRLS